MSLPEKDRLAYTRYQDDLRYQTSLIESNYGIMGLVTCARFFGKISESLT
jgi:hypothetical protein